MHSTLSWIASFKSICSRLVCLIDPRQQRHFLLIRCDVPVIAAIAGVVFVNNLPLSILHNPVAICTQAMAVSLKAMVQHY